VPQPTDDKAARKAALAFERKQRRRESQRRKEDAARERQVQRREQAIAKAQAALEKSEREHDTRVATIEAEREVFEKKIASGGRPLGQGAEEAGERSASGEGVAASLKAVSGTHWAVTEFPHELHKDQDSLCRVLTGKDISACHS
jgi:hypothetical protein